MRRCHVSAGYIIPDSDKPTCHRALFTQDFSGNLFSHFPKFLSEIVALAVRTSGRHLSQGANVGTAVCSRVFPHIWRRGSMQGDQRSVERGFGELCDKKPQHRAQEWDGFLIIQDSLRGDSTWVERDRERR